MLAGNVVTVAIMLRHLVRKGNEAKIDFLIAREKGSLAVAVSFRHSLILNALAGGTLVVIFGLASIGGAVYDYYHPKPKAAEFQIYDI
jgi:hypothetical protein